MFVAFSVALLSNATQTTPTTATPTIATVKLVHENRNSTSLLTQRNGVTATEPLHHDTLSEGHVEKKHKLNSSWDEPIAVLVLACDREDVSRAIDSLLK